MKYVNLGRAGVKVSRICLGAMTYGDPAWRPWILTEEQGRPFIKRALEQGINFFDTADMYSLGRSEEILGRAIRDFARRDGVVIATKAYFPMSDDPNDRGLSRKHLLPAIDASLRRLGTDYVDLYQIHRYDPETPIEETLRALDDIVRSGKARYIGASSMSAWQFATRALSRRSPRLDALRLDAEPLQPRLPGGGARDAAAVPRGGHRRHSRGARSRAGFSRATAARRQGGNRPRADRRHCAQAVLHRVGFQDRGARGRAGGRRGVSAAQIALAWLLHQPGVTAPIVGASKMDQLDEAVAAVDMTLTEEERTELEELYQPHPVRW